MIHKKLFIFILIFLSVPVILTAQSRSGDAELDRSLRVLDAEAKASYASFKLELSKNYTVPVAKIDRLKLEVGMSGGDIYMCLELSRISRKAIDDVVVLYRENKERGWGYIAKELGIKPGSAEFHQLKGNAKEKGKQGKKPSKGKGKGKGNN